MPLTTIQRLREERINAALTFSCVPGVQVKEIREYLGLKPIGDPKLDDLVLNLPVEASE